MIPPDQYHRLGECDLVGDEVVTDGVDGLLKARCLGDDGLCDRGDGTGGLYRMTAGADVLGRVMVRDGGEGDGGVRGEFDDLLVVLERGTCGSPSLIVARAISRCSRMMRSNSSRRFISSPRFFLLYNIVCIKETKRNAIDPT